VLALQCLCLCLPGRRRGPFADTFAHDGPLSGQGIKKKAGSGELGFDSHLEGVHGELADFNPIWEYWSVGVLEYWKVGDKANIR
jgi:hypothetical protein